MREKSSDKLILLPFALGCISESSVAIASPNQNEPKSNDDHGERARWKDVHGPGDGEREECLSDESVKNSFAAVPVPKPNISAGIHRLYKGMKNFSHMFVYKEDEEAEEVEIEIGEPTNVKHVIHIGWDGCITTNNIFFSGPMSELPVEAFSSRFAALSFLSNQSKVIS
ncbi:hypothetical protein MLD38_027443 [Melastoma candidum]|uniref:Uncharacterized protein n=1 Tax=Melastoma candidum TaxID=119954 RepID=A0ACB9P2U4_9MYRT|nr:hypothetical protein MLD38_027443 [Melastoma candidum]